MHSPLELESVLLKIEALAAAVGYLFEPDEQELRSELVECIELAARKALTQVQGGGIMNNSIPLDMAEYRAGLAGSLWSVILEKASQEKCSPVLIDLLCMACDASSEARQALRAELEKPEATDIPAVNTAQSVSRGQFWEVRNEAECALTASKEARELLSMWSNTLPCGEERESESLRVGLLVNQIHDAITHLEKAVAVKEV